MTEKYKVIQDQIGRIIIGAFAGETETTVTLQNPVILHVQPDRTGQLQVNTLPAFFFELASSESRKDMQWTYNKNNIVDSNIEPDEKVVQQYKRINTPAQSSKQPEGNIVSITDL